MKAILAGSGWRAAFYKRISEKVPSLLTISAVYSHRSGYESDLGRALSAEHDCVIVSTSNEHFLPLMRELKKRGEKVIAETSFLHLSSEEQDELMDMEGFTAEQYPHTPLYASVLAAVPLVGKVSQIRISGLHNHHAAAIARKVLNLGDALPDTVSSLDFPYRICRTASRDGLLIGSREKEECLRRLRFLAFGDRLFINDFSSNQYHSVFYGKEIEIRGESGVITEKGVRCLNEDGFPIELPFSFHRDDYHQFRGTVYSSLGGRILWQNRFPGCGFTDDEIGIAELLHRFSVSAEGYTIRDGILDARLGKML